MSRTFKPSIPQRSNLVGQVRDILRDGIRRGTWTEVLPGEIELCRTFQVSRMTLRAALETLARDGWVVASQGRRRRILRRKARPFTARKSRRIVLVSAVPLERMRAMHLLHVDGVREKLALAGFELEVHASPACFSAKPEAVLSHLVREKPAAAWVLYNATAPLQRWFMEQRQPCLIVGARHPAIRLPAIGTDYFALGRHAAGQLLRRRHRRLAVLIPDEEAAGHANSVAGFRAACSEIGAAEVRVIRHDGTPAGLRRCLEQMMRDAPPTGVLVALPQFALGTVTMLGDAGVDVGRTVSVIARDSDPYLDYVVPTLARYAIDLPRFVQKLARILLLIVQGGIVPIRDTLLVPEFIPGATLGHVSG
jgi:LacI family transcriptional regulator